MDFVIDWIGCFAVQEQDKKLALPSIEEQATITERPFNVDTWTYKPDNAVMYVPEGR